MGNAEISEILSTKTKNTLLEDELAPGSMLDTTFSGTDTCLFVHFTSPSLSLISNRGPQHS